MENIPEKESCVLKSDTNCGENYLEFTWTIQHLSSMLHDRKIFSPPFSRLYRTDYEWRLFIIPKNKNAEDNDSEYLSVRLEATGFHGDQIHVSFEFSVIRNDGFKYSKSDTHIYEYITDNWGFDYFIKYSELVNEKYLENDTLRVMCRLVYPVKDINYHIQDTSYFDMGDINEDFSRNVKLLYEDDYLSDVCLEVGEAKFHLHKIILSSRSSIFNKMFKNDMKNEQQNVIKITEIKPEAMKQLIKYMYTDTVDDIESHAIELLKAAETYDMLGLKIICENTLCNSLTVDNVAEIFESAEKYEAQKLKVVAIKFIKDNLLEMLQNSNSLNFERFKLCLFDIVKSTDINKQLIN